MAGLVFEGYFVDAGTPSSFIQAASACILNNRFSTGRREGIIGLERGQFLKD